MDRKRHDIGPRFISKSVSEKEIEELLRDILKPN
jgi:hypothetical protein